MFLLTEPSALFWDVLGIRTYYLYMFVCVEAVVVAVAVKWERVAAPFMIYLVHNDDILYTTCVHWSKNFWVQSHFLLSLFFSTLTLSFLLLSLFLVGHWAFWLISFRLLPFLGVEWMCLI